MVAFLLFSDPILMQKRSGPRKLWLCDLRICPTSRESGVDKDISTGLNSISYGSTYICALAVW